MSPEHFKTVTLEDGPRVHTYAGWLLKDLDEAQDVTQETFLRLWIDRDRVDVAAARTWLLRTAHHLCVDRWRRRTAGPGAAGALPEALVASGDGSPDVVAAGRDLREAIARGLADLPLRDRAVILLRERHGLSYANLTTVLGMPLGSVKAALHRARRRLRDALLELEVLS